MAIKQLTITIPAYNAENYIKRCLDSFLDREGNRPDKRLEILVINDGSTDGTQTAAEDYERQFPDCIRVISKENGGHGSGINTGLRCASGRYFKVVDADDWVVTENLEAILDALEMIDSDVVITGYKSVNERTGAEQFYSTSCDRVNCEIGIQEFGTFFENLPATFQFHGLAYRTSFLQTAGISMSEGVYYEDQEYAILPFLTADTILLLQHTLYVYRLGGSGQSVSFENMEKRLSDMEQVLKKLLSAYLQAKQTPEWQDERNRYCQKRLAIAVTSYYAAALVKAADKKQGKQHAAAFHDFLRNEEPELAARVEGKYNTLLKAGKIPGLAGAYEKFSDSGVYQNMKKIWNRTN